MKSSHAATVVGLMEAAGYDAAACEKVKRWILKKDIKTDPENQVGMVDPIGPAGTARQWQCNTLPAVHRCCSCSGAVWVVSVDLAEWRGGLQLDM